MLSETTASTRTNSDAILPTLETPRPCWPTPICVTHHTLPLTRDGHVPIATSSTQPPAPRRRPKMPPTVACSRDYFSRQPEKQPQSITVTHCQSGSPCIQTRVAVITVSTAPPKLLSSCSETANKRTAAHQKRERAQSHLYYNFKAQVRFGCFALLLNCQTNVDLSKVLSLF